VPAAQQKSPLPNTKNETRDRYLEGDPTIQAHARRLMHLRKRQSMRETKRMLNLWGFYLRVLSELKVPGINNPLVACDVMTLAEIIARWPAFVPALSGEYDGKIGVSRALHAAQDAEKLAPADGAELWRNTMEALDLHEMSTSELKSFRRLLATYGSNRVAEYSYYLL
jgi:hypothetical protein